MSLFDSKPNADSIQFKKSVSFAKLIILSENSLTEDIFVIIQLNTAVMIQFTSTTVSILQSLPNMKQIQFYITSVKVAKFIINEINSTIKQKAIAISSI